MCSLYETLLAFVIGNFVLQGRYLLTLYFCILIPCDEKDIFLLLLLILEDLVGLHKISQQLLKHWWLGHRLGLREGLIMIKILLVRLKKYLFFHYDQ